VPYRVVIRRTARDQLLGAPPLLGYVDGILAVLPVDPHTATAAFDIRKVDDEFWEVIFAGGRGILGFWVLEQQQVIAVENVTWID
jgi:hypothetical protein